jgi:AcrR family transcriptional regulator
MSIRSVRRGTRDGPGPELIWDDMRVTEPADWRARKRDETHHRIYSTAMRLFQEHGFEHVSVGQIAAGAHVSVPTFYAHYASKEQIVIQLVPEHLIAEALAEQPEDLPLSERIRRGMPHFLANFGPEFRAELLARWKIVASTPSLRLRAAEYERTTAGQVVNALTSPAGGPLPPESIVAAAYLSAFTAALLAWADSDGQRELEDAVEEAFRALQGN